MTLAKALATSHINKEEMWQVLYQVVLTGKPGFKGSGASHFFPRTTLLVQKVLHECTKRVPVLTP